MENNVEKGIYFTPKYSIFYYLRWHNHLDPMVRKSPWNETEEFVFI